MPRPQCPQCGKLLVMPAGPPASTILLVGEFPGVEEVKSGRPFVGRAGEILEAEMARIGLQLNQFRITNLWLHQTQRKGETCSLDFHIQELLKEMAGRKHLLLMGSDVIKALCKKGVMEMSSLRVVGPLIPSDTIAIASPNPAAAMHGGVGEFRLAMRRFKESLNVP